MERVGLLAAAVEPAGTNITKFFRDVVFAEHNRTTDSKRDDKKTDIKKRDFVDFVINKVSQIIEKVLFIFRRKLA